MIDPSETAKWDQAKATLVEIHPPLWAGLYKALLAEGVPAADATAMVCAYIQTTCGTK